MRLQILAAALFCVPITVAAQDDSLPQSDSEWMAWVPEENAVEIPLLVFEPTQEDRDSYEKYYYFHREETDFATALADLRECDAHARGLHRRGTSVNMAPAMVQYGVLAGAIGGALGSVFSDAINGSAEARLKRRINMRRCMFYKEYSRYGLSKDVWEGFNFEEGLSVHTEEFRQRRLAVQARVAAGVKPQAEELGL